MNTLSNFSFRPFLDICSHSVIIFFSSFSGEFTLFIHLFFNLWATQNFISIQQKFLRKRYLKIAHNETRLMFYEEIKFNLLIVCGLRSID